jgi:hypothetical protein
MFIRVVQPLNRLIFAAMNTMISIAPQDLSAHIYLIRGRNVLLDDYLAKLYGVSTKSLNQAVKRNPDRFPPDFMFQLSDNEWINLRSQNVTSNEIKEQGGRRLTETISLNLRIPKGIIVHRRLSRKHYAAFENDGYLSG